LTLELYHCYVSSSFFTIIIYVLTLDDSWELYNWNIGTGCFMYFHLLITLSMQMMWHCSVLAIKYILMLIEYFFSITFSLDYIACLWSRSLCLNHTMTTQYTLIYFKSSQTMMFAYTYIYTVTWISLFNNMQINDQAPAILPVFYLI